MIFDLKWASGKNGFAKQVEIFTIGDLLQLSLREGKDLIVSTRDESFEARQRAGTADGQPGPELPVPLITVYDGYIE